SVDIGRPFQLADREVLLSFDDGPSPAHTPSVLRTLDLFGVGAVFFMVGVNATRWPATAQQVRAHGHLVGSHTATHPPLVEMPPGTAAAEIAEGHAAVGQALGSAPAPLFRFPYLEDSAALREIVGRQGLVVVGADMMILDWTDRTPDEILAIALDEIGRAGGGTVVLHDVQGRTARMLPWLLATLARRGYSVVTPTLAARVERPGEVAVAA
ncbi:MAG TPA: polysaccharide deacetylase family protein, partial [Devosia sp.]|nr:polysaccharide deacetylase family protein [Devosia sp.]